MGHRVVEKPSNVSTDPRGDELGESTGGKGIRQPVGGAVERGAVPNESAAITS